MASEDAPDPAVLIENQSSEPIPLTTSERDQLLELVPNVSLVPMTGEEGRYSINPGNNVGAVQLGERRFELRPKLPIRRLLFLMSYSMDPKNWRRLGFDFDEKADLFEALIPGFAFQLEESLRQGLRSGYRSEEDALQTVRGRIRFNDQLRARFGLIPPIECRFDEFTDDTEMNRLLKAAIARLGEIRIRNIESRRRLQQLASAFAGVSSVRYDFRAIPEVRFDRLNEHFRRPVEFARLILRSRSLESQSGTIGGAAFLVDLSTVFEDFVVLALREVLELSSRQFPQQAKGRALYLDEGKKLRLKPDVSWWDGDHCVFIGDVKYKKTPPSAGVQHPDMYQLLAYTTASALPKGMLIYAAGGEPSQNYRIPMAQKEIEVLTLDLAQEPDGVLKQIQKIADLVRAQASLAHGLQLHQEAPSLA